MLLRLLRRVLLLVLPLVLIRILLQLLLQALLQMEGLTGPKAMCMHVVFFVCHLHVSHNSASHDLKVPPRAGIAAVTQGLLGAHAHTLANHSIPGQLDPQLHLAEIGKTPMQTMACAHCLHMASPTFVAERQQTGLSRQGLTHLSLLPPRLAQGYVPGDCSHG